MYGVPKGKLVAGRTEWKMDMIFPELREMTIVAAVSAPATTALDDTSTVMGDATSGLSGEVGGVEEPLLESYMAMMKGGQLPWHLNVLRGI